MPLAPLDPRQRAEAEARVRAAEDSKREADAQVEHLKADLDQARRDRDRTDELVRAGVLSRQELEQAQNAEVTIAKDLEAARFRSQSIAHDVEVARAALLTLDRQQNGSAPTTVNAPVSGQVLRVFEESERVVTAGTPLIELSNPSKLEVEIDLLSTDAVKVTNGARIIIDSWGDQKNLEARVRLVEPSAFTKVSALGIEEQRVYVIGDFVEPTPRLGDGYRVEAHIVTWEGDEVLKVPGSALFRTGDKWSVFVVEAGKARRQQVEVGQRTSLEVEVLGGVADGAEVIVHPANELSDGARVQSQRNSLL
jgi:HlyD family secretion protein